MHATVSADAHRLSGQWGSLKVHRFGATVMSWAPGGLDQLFVSEGTVVELGRMWHGGIPLCAPWFGQGLGLDWEVPFGHGLVSRVAWEAEEVHCDDEGARITLVTDGAATAHLDGASRFPADLSYRYEVAADDTSLSLRLTVTSPTQPAHLEAMFHPYLAVDAPATTLTGLGGLAFRDYATSADGAEPDPLRFAGAVDRVYAEAPEVTLADPSHTLALTPEGASTSVVWNPGPDDQRFAAGTWQRFCCVEFGDAAGGAVDLAAGASHTIGMRLSVR